MWCTTGKECWAPAIARGHVRYRQGVLGTCDSRRGRGVHYRQGVLGTCDSKGGICGALQARGDGHLR